jgi:hypothetical protein
MFQLWTTSKLGQLSPALRRDVSFYAPLLESLDFMGVEPVTFTRPVITARLSRAGQTHFIGVDVPKFDFQGELPYGIYMVPGALLQYAVANALDNANTLIWFEELVPKSTPTQAPPFNSAGQWAGALGTHIKHICKFTRILSNAEINTVQAVLGEAVQVIPPPPPPPSVSAGVFINEVPAGSGVTFTLSNDPNINSLIVNAHGVVLKRVASAPGNIEYTLGGAGNRVITMGMAPSGTSPTQVFYVVA